MESLKVAVSQLSLVAPKADPSPGLRDRLIQRLGLKNPHFTFATAGSAVWEPTPIEGVMVRQLFTDGQHERMTMLVRMSAGVRYPKHCHTGAEECYVIDGDLLVEGVRMGPGDYVRAEAGSIHDTVSTENGCLLLIGCHVHDEILPLNHA